MLPENVFFEGEVPEGYALAVCPSENYIVLDVDRHGKKDGFEAIPRDIETELAFTFSYPTKNNGKHFWLRYTGDKHLANKASGKGIDLRTNKGYVVWYPNEDIRDVIECNLVMDTSENMNYWLESLFSYV
jgi:hypothetical protein